MSIFSFIAGIFKPAADLVDNLHTSEEERGQIRNELASIQQQANSKIIELEQARLDALSKVETAESSSRFWLRANWRPICALTLVGIIVADSFQWITAGAQIYDLAQIFLGAYTSSRGLEKIASTIKLGK